MWWQSERAVAIGVSRPARSRAAKASSSVATGMTSQSVAPGSPGTFDVVLALRRWHEEHVDPGLGAPPTPSTETADRADGAVDLDRSR